MAKKDRAGRPPAGDAALPDTPFRRARWAMEAGDVRRARALAAEAAGSGPEPEREEARKLLERLGPDPRALLAAAVALVLIALAAWLAIFRH